VPDTPDPDADWKAAWTSAWESAHPGTAAPLDDVDLEMIDLIADRFVAKLSEKISDAELINSATASQDAAWAAAHPGEQRTFGPDDDDG
jgi:hypothetical protein